MRGEEGAVVRRVVDRRRPRRDTARAARHADLDPVGGVGLEVREVIHVVELDEAAGRHGPRNDGPESSGRVAEDDLDGGRLPRDLRDADVQAEARGFEARHEDESRPRGGGRGRGLGRDRKAERASARRRRGGPRRGDDGGRRVQEDRAEPVAPERVPDHVVEGSRRQGRERDGERARRLVLP